MWGWISRRRRRQAAATLVRAPVVRARYDAAQTSDNNRNHWAYTDSLSARLANSPDVRQRLRERGRYEVANNCYARGMVSAVADIVIGTGPQLQIPRDWGNSQGRADDELVERLFDEWADEVGLGAMLWTGRVAKAVDGECCGIFRTRDSLESPVKLYPQAVETDQFSSGSTFAAFDNSEVDGIQLNDAGDVIGYWVLRHHPSESLAETPISVPADAGWIWFREERPGQLRGIPEITPALELFGQLRRFIQATLDAAEFAARPSGLLSTEAPPATDVPDGQPWERIEFERGGLLTLPNQTTLHQLKPEHPGSTFREFVEQLLVQIGRCLNLPRAVALGDASEYNYASGRLDHQAFERAVAVDQETCRQAILRKTWRAWLLEAQRIGGYLPPRWRTIDALLVRPEWIWAAKGHVDRQKEAMGAQTELNMGLTTLAAECAKRGLDWERVLAQRALEMATMAELGLLPTTEGGTDASERTDADAVDD